MLTTEEKKLFITDKNRYDYEFLIYDVDNNTVAGKTQDEWGALLVRVAEEYSGFGFGELLVSLHRKYVPHVDSGGFTPQGENNVKKVHAYFVYRKNNITIDHFAITHNNQHIIISGLATPNKKDSVIADLKSVDVSYIMNLVNFHSVDFS